MARPYTLIHLFVQQKVGESLKTRKPLASSLIPSCNLTCDILMKIADYR
jgi:hypothetical protein